MANPTIIFNQNLINIINKYISSNKLNIYTAYELSHILNIICSISKEYFTKYILPNDLLLYFNIQEGTKLTKDKIKSYLKQDLNKYNDEIFLKTYVVIGYDIPVKINELTVELNYLNI